MSSLAAVQADGYYVPPEYYDSSIHKRSRGSIAKNAWHQSSGGRKKPKTTTDSVVRFELPFTGQCQHCENIISKGTRFNATKSDTGEHYFTTPIFQFRMKCRNTVSSHVKHEPGHVGGATYVGCPGIFIIQTDPKNRSFRYVSGIQMLRRTLPERDVIDESAVGRFEQARQYQQSQQTLNLERIELQATQDARHERTLYDASHNAALRAQFRQQRHAQERQLQAATRLGWNRRRGTTAADSSPMLLLDSTLPDQVQAMSVTFGNGQATERERFEKLRQSSIFERRRDERSRSNTAAEPKKKKSRRGDRLGDRSRRSTSHDTPVELVMSANTREAAEPTSNRRKHLAIESFTVLDSKLKAGSSVPLVNETTQSTPKTDPAEASQDDLATRALTATLANKQAEAVPSSLAILLQNYDSGSDGG
jgi:coiled-coil domain-containing protein 130